MKLPKKIKVARITYTIQEELNKNCLGSHEIIKDKEFISIKKGMSDETTRNIFFHELTHAILYQIGAFKQEKNELFVQSLANELDNLFELKQ